MNSTNTNHNYRGTPSQSAIFAGLRALRNHAMSIDYRGIGPQFIHNSRIGWEDEGFGGLAGAAHALAGDCCLEYLSQGALASMMDGEKWQALAKLRARAEEFALACMAEVAR